nr:uncharacterized protein LOC113829596 [Penaeus vannamei]
MIIGERTLEYWLKAIRSDQKTVRQSLFPILSEFFIVPTFTPNTLPNIPFPHRTPDTHEGDTEEEEAQTLAALQAQVRDAVGRVGAAGRSGGGGGGGGGEGGASEADLDVGRELKWRRMALNRLKDYRNREDSRTTKLVDYQAKHSLPPEEAAHKDEGAGEGGGGGGGGGEVEPPFDIENEVQVPPPSVSVRAVEAQLWTLLGNLEIDCKKIRENVNRIARVQENLLLQVNLFRAEWGHALFTLPHLPHHLQVQVSDELVNEFYCDLLELEECEDTDDVPGGDVRRGTQTTPTPMPRRRRGGGRGCRGRQRRAGCAAPEPGRHAPRRQDAQGPADRPKPPRRRHRPHALQLDLPHAQNDAAQRSWAPECQGVAEAAAHATPAHESGASAADPAATHQLPVFADPGSGAAEGLSEGGGPRA